MPPAEAPDRAIEPAAEPNDGPAGTSFGSSPSGEAAQECAEQLESDTDFARVRDGFDRLWTPHRMAYVTGDRPSEAEGSGCPFCAAPGKDDAAGLIVHRGRHCYVVMNLFPYNAGHLLICPYRHVPRYLDLSDEETAEFTALTKDSIVALTAASAPMGFNIGMNQGAVAGAGVAAHLHQHVVPRWGGDMNFLPIIGQTKALPVLLEDARLQLVENWPARDADAR